MSAVDIVPVPPDRCPDCDEPLHVECVGQLPLLRHGGYGAVRDETTRWCPACGYQLHHQTQETKP